MVVAFLLYMQSLSTNLKTILMVRELLHELVYHVDRALHAKFVCERESRHLKVTVKIIGPVLAPHTVDAREEAARVVETFNGLEPVIV